MGLGDGSVLDGLVHPALFEALPRFYPTLVEVQAETRTRRPNGEVATTWETTLVAYGNLARAERAQGESREPTQTVVSAAWVLSLDGHYPQIEVEQRVVAKGQVFNVSRVIHDSVDGSTQLELEETRH